jgi:preprotein translocase subunit SecA
MVQKVNRDVVSTLVKGQIPMSAPSQVREADDRKRTDMSKYSTQKSDMPEVSSGRRTEGGDTREPQKVQPVRVEKKVGRNDPCPCGSGKKYKSCHGKNAE